jgi:cell division protein FtsB
MSEREQGTGRARRGPIRFFGLGGTRRAAVLAIVACALALTVAVPLRTYLGQRSEVTEQVQRQQRLRAEVTQLEKRKAELSDPEQVQAEARERLRYVMPGETPYEVQLPGDDERAERPDSKRPEDKPESWYDKLWESINKGGR